MAGISIWQLLIVLVIILLLFGSKNLKNLGSDLGSALKGFKKATSDEPVVEEKEKDEATQSKITREKV